MKKISIKNFSKSFGGVTVFDSFFCVFNEGINVVMGPSGSGKTTLLNAVAGLVTYDGVIEIDEIEYKNKSSAAVSYVFQEHRLIAQKTVFQNLDFVLAGTISDKRERRQKIEEVLCRIGLGGEGGLYPGQLSGGMAQRVSLARAFLYPSDILLMDEPFKGLDSDTKDNVIEVFFRLWEEGKRTVLFVTHDRLEAYRLGGVLYQPSKNACLQGHFCDHDKGLKPRPKGRNQTPPVFGVQGSALGFKTLYNFPNKPIKGEVVGEIMHNA